MIYFPSLLVATIIIVQEYLNILVGVTGLTFLSPVHVNETEYHQKYILIQFKLKKCASMQIA